MGGRGSQLPGRREPQSAQSWHASQPEYSLPSPPSSQSPSLANVHVFMHVPPPGGCARAQRRWWHTRARAQANNAVRRRFDHAAARAGSMRARKAQQRCGVQGARNASCMMGKSSIATVILGTHPRWWRIGRWRRVVAVRIRVRRSWRPVAVGAWATVGTVGTRSAALILSAMAAIIALSAATRVGSREVSKRSVRFAGKFSPSSLP